jgi:predicted Rossmann fold nucleotide-binding protein DprA/Smf involved in DNA uptake
MADKAYLDQLKTLRGQRGDRKDLTELRKTQVQHEKAILAAIATEPKTVPEIAAETGIHEQLVFWLINALRKYNKIESVKKRGDYMTYLKASTDGNNR